MIEIIDQRGLAAPGDEDHLLDPRLARLVDRILDQRPVDDRDHLLGDALGGGEQAGAEAGDGEHRLADAIGHSGYLLELTPVSLVTGCGSDPAGCAGAAPPVGGGRSNGSSRRGCGAS